MDFSYSQKVEDYRARLAGFMDEVVYPNERTFFEQVEASADRWVAPKLERALQVHQDYKRILGKLHRISACKYCRKEGRGLSAYADHPLLRTVGVDRTYYHPIGTDEFRTYADDVPDDFRFLVKADRLLTSPMEPEGYGVRRPNMRFLDPAYAADEVVAPMVEGLGAKAGPLLLQFSPIPPNLVGGPGAFVERLHRFVDALPEGPLYAIELRTPAFLTEAYIQMLEATGAAHCYNVHPSMTPLDRQMELVQPFYQPALIVRWMLHAGLRYEAAKDRYQPFDRLVDEDASSRERIALAVLDTTIAERDAFVVANNKAEGSAPISIFRLAERIANWRDASTGSEPVAS